MKQFYDVDITREVTIHIDAIEANSPEEAEMLAEQMLDEDSNAGTETQSEVLFVDAYLSDDQEEIIELNNPEN